MLYAPISLCSPVSEVPGIFMFWFSVVFVLTLSVSPTASHFMVCFPSHLLFFFFLVIYFLSLENVLKHLLNEHNKTVYLQNFLKWVNRYKEVWTIPGTSEVLRKISSYFITDISIIVWLLMLLATLKVSIVLSVIYHCELHHQIYCFYFIMWASLVA